MGACVCVCVCAYQRELFNVIAAHVTCHRLNDSNILRSINAQIPVFVTHMKRSGDSL